VAEPAVATARIFWRILIWVKRMQAPHYDYSAMKSEWRKYACENAPRYTSYPSALYFDDSISTDDYSVALSSIEVYQPISLYVHLPFCRQLCWYCGCNMRVENRYDRALQYLESLKAECRLLGSRLNGRGRLVSVHFGGGTPNFFHHSDLADFVDVMEGEFGLTDDTHLSIELDPRMVRPGEVEALAQIGFNRMSLGVQDFDAEVQRSVNRVQSYALIEECVASMRENSIGDVSFDILYGLPHQSPESFNDTIDKVIALAPDRVAVFGYAHLPRRLKGQALIDSTALPDADARLNLLILADRKLRDADYVRIGFDHFAKPDSRLARFTRDHRLRRNFQGFTDDIAETVIGLGVSAISYVNGAYTQNEKAISTYQKRVEAGQLPVAKGWAQNSTDRKYAEIITELLCYSRVDLGDSRFACSRREQEQIRQRLKIMEADQMVRFKGDALILDDAAWLFSRAVAAAIDPYQVEAGRMAATV